jgi:hypothetical protein
MVQNTDLIKIYNVYLKRHYLEVNRQLHAQSALIPVSDFPVTHWIGG